ncbi:MAG: PQQ-binding-like beta-propeller repeat protein, partial [Thermoplasmatales archaeon]|nr:PQQ-binding-like beta-propeller repeat protein [Thermoplasmatales archaeon]
ADGKVFVGSFSGNLYCLDASDGQEIWSRPAGSGGVLSSPAVADGKVYFGSYDNNVYCLDASTGAIIWQHLTADDVGSSPAVADGKVFIGSKDCNLYCFGQPDTTPPEITDVQATPSIQTSGGYVNITATVTDDIAVDTVTVNITSPVLVFPAEEMINVPGTDTYYYNATYTEVGTYDYFIWADDTSENENTSDTYQFEIEIMCNIEIEISGGLGINAIIRNTGEEDVTDLEYSIALDGGFILLPRGGVATGTIDIPAGDEVSIGAIVLGLGRSEITVTAGCAEETASGLVILLFVLGV